jgi:hypothetical protein
MTKTGLSQAKNGKRSLPEDASHRLEIEPRPNGARLFYAQNCIKSTVTAFFVKLEYFAVKSDF